MGDWICKICWISNFIFTSLIIPAAIRRRLQMIRHLQHPHTRYSQLAGTPSLCIQMRRNDPKTQTTQILKQYYKLTIVNWAKVRRQFWTLIGYVLAQLLILNNFYEKSYRKQLLAWNIFLKCITIITCMFESLKPHPSGSMWMCELIKLDTSNSKLILLLAKTIRSILLKVKSQRSYIQRKPRRRTQESPYNLCLTSGCPGGTACHW